MKVRIKEENGYVDAEWTIEDGVMVVSPKEVKFEPKDGDVVYAGGFYDFVFIYKDNHIVESYYYAALRVKDGKIILPDGGHIGYVSQLRPATEEEKKLLFDKLAEEGYEFDFDKKELVKIKWKPKDGESYFYPSMYKCKILCCNDEWSNDVVDILIYNKGWVFKTEQECQEFCNRLNDALSQVKP